MGQEMTEIGNQEIVELAKRYNREGVTWHNHFLARKCIYNTGGKFQVVVENENTGEVHVSNFDKQPTETLKLLEDLFFEQDKEG